MPVTPDTPATLTAHEWERMSWHQRQAYCNWLLTRRREEQRAIATLRGQRTYAEHRLADVQTHLRDTEAALAGLQADVEDETPTTHSPAAGFLDALAHITT